MTFDRRLARRAALWIGLAAAVFFGNLQLQTTLGERALAATGLEIHSLDEGLVLAAREDKPVLAVVSAIWCSSCRTFDRRVLADRAVHGAIDDGYVFVRLEHGSEEGKAFRKRYGVRGLPAFAVLRADGSLVERLPVDFDPDVFRAEL